MRHKNVSDDVKEKASKDRTDRIREEINTTDLPAIMDRFYRAVGGGR